MIDLMLADMEKADPLYQPTLFWRQCIPEILADIELFGIENFLAHPSSSDYYAPVAPPEQLERYLSVLPKRIDQQSSVGRPFYRDYPSATSLNYLRGLEFMGEPKPKRVLEIGGGYGALGEILGGSGYIDVDLPPLAAIATYYLREVFGHDAVLDYTQTRDWEEIPVDAAPILVLCPWQLPRLVGSVDLCVNFISFQEMEPDVVQNYLRHFKRHEPERLLLRNSATGKEDVLTPITRDNYIEWSKPWKLVRSDVDTFGDRCGNFASEVMLFQRS